MPQYDYRCEVCNALMTITRSIHDDAVAPPHCGIEMRQVYSTPGIKFNGSGFYSTGG